MFGDGWWTSRGRALQEIRDAAKRKEERKVKRAGRKDEKLAMRKLRRKMGIVRYYCCPCLRFLYADPKAAVDPSVEEERQRKIREMLAEKRRLELLIKNPVTHEYKVFSKKKEDFEAEAEEEEERQRRTAKGGNDGGGHVGFLEGKIDKVDGWSVGGRSRCNTHTHTHTHTPFGPFVLLSHPYPLLRCFCCLAA